MRRWLFLSEYHWVVLLGMLGLSATVVAWVSLGLVSLAMANLSYLTSHGLFAVREGGLLQMLGIGAKASVVLGAYLLFKAIETELIFRWRNARR